MRIRFGAFGLGVLPFAILFSAAFTSTAAADPPSCSDAELLSLELSGELLPPPDLVQQIGDDLTAVYAWDDYFAGIHVFPSWVPGMLFVGLTDAAWQDFEAGDYHGLDSLNALYGPVEIEALDFIHYLLLTFTRPYHPEVLAAIYALADGVRDAGPNHIYGDGDDLRCEEVGHYLFRRGWGDCMSGCTYEHVWIFRVENGQATLVTHYGSPLEDPPNGACCLANETCVVTTHWDCEGSWHGTGVSCDPNPCIGTPITQESWGTIKARFH